MSILNDTSSRLVFISCAFGILAISSNAVADSNDRGFDYGELDPVFEEPLEKKGHIDFGPLDAVFDNYFIWKQNLADETGFTYVIEDRFINSWADGAHIHDNEINLIGRWEFLADEAYGTHSINAWGQFAQSVGHITGSEFQSEIGILSPLCGCNGGPETTNELLQMLAYEWIAPGNHFRLQLGKLATRTLINLNRYANGDSEMFFTPMLGNNTVAPYTALLGVGAFVQWKEDSWYISGLVRAPGVERGISLDAIERGDQAYAVEFALTPTISGLGYGEYRFIYSFDHATAVLPEVSTIGLSFDQDLGDRIGAFFKYNYSDNTWRSFESQIAAGFQIKKPFGFVNDRIGIGVWWGDPVDQSLDQETGVELYYKAQIKTFLEITPNIQFVFNPAYATEEVETVVGLRVRGLL